MVVRPPRTWSDFQENIFTPRIFFIPGGLFLPLNVIIMPIVTMIISAIIIIASDVNLV